MILVVGAGDRLLFDSGRPGAPAAQVVLHAALDVVERLRGAGERFYLGRVELEGHRGLHLFAHAPSARTTLLCLLERLEADSEERVRRLLHDLHQLCACAALNPLQPLDAPLDTPGFARAARALLQQLEP